MKPFDLLALLASTCLAACGGSSEAGSAPAGGSPSESSPGGSVEHVTDPAQLPSDEAGLAQVYVGLMTEVVTTLEGIDTEAQLTAGLDRIESLAPAFAALMQKSEELELPVDEGGRRADVDALVERMEEANKAVLQKFPRRAMEILNAFSAMTGGVGPR